MFDKDERVHLVGIKGVGMTALAQILLSRGCKVTGSDGQAKFFTDEVIKRFKIPLSEKFAAENIPKDVDFVISSSAYFHKGESLGNAEVTEALNRKLKVLTYPQALGELAKDYKVIAVAGSHGKSTTTALLGWIMEKVKLDPNVIVGTKVNGWESNARSGKSEYLIVEADEYREAFLNYRPFGAIITSIDYDHPDYFKTPDAYYKSFEKFADNIDPKGFLIGCGDDDRVKQICLVAKKRGIKALTYGFDPKNDVFVADKGIAKQKQMFHIMFSDKHFGLTGVSFPGKQYILNSAAALATARLLGADRLKEVEAIKTFPGTARRLEVVKKATKSQPAIIIDDYAHHPTAIRITLEGICKLYSDRKIVAIFQPHMFSRTAALLDEFAKSFSVADEVGLMEIYPSARETSGPVSGKDLAEKAKQYHEHVTYLKDIEAGKHFVKRFLDKKVVIVLMGAGDVNSIAS
jgi:UDP-N-acetylmuramate--alanine ligase